MYLLVDWVQKRICLQIKKEKSLAQGQGCWLCSNVNLSSGIFPEARQGKPSPTSYPQLINSARVSADESMLLLLLLSHFSRVRLCATHRWQPTRLRRPWDSPGKNTGVACHCLLHCVKVKSESEVAQSRPWTAAYQAPPSMGFSRQEYWSGLPLPSPASEH